MGASFKLAGELTMNEGDFTRGLGKADSALKSFFKGAAAGAAGFLAANVIAKGISAVSNGVKSAISDASDLNESMNKSNVIFGENADVIADWSKSAAQNFGLSKQAALETTGTLGNLFKGMGIGADANADMSMKTVAAAADLASFNNVAGGTEQVLADIQSGLVGEVEPLRKYGILLNEAKVGQKAMAMTGKANVKQLTEGEKVAARYALIMDQIGDAQGDFARTSGDSANAGRIFHAQMTNLSASIGGKLLPILTRTTDAANRFLSRFDDKRAQGFGVWEAGLSALHTTLDQVFGKQAGDAMIAVISAIGGAIDDVVSAVGRLAGALFSGDLSGFFSELGNDLAALASTGFDLGVITVKAIFELVTNVAGDLWQWVVNQIMGKDSGGGAMPTQGGSRGGPMTSAAQQDAHDIPFGTVLVTAALELAGEIAKWAGNIWGWIEGKLGLGGGGHEMGSGGLGVAQGGGGHTIVIPSVIVDIANMALGTVGLSITNADVAKYVQDKLDTLGEIKAELKEWKILLGSPQVEASKEDAQTATENKVKSWGPFTLDTSGDWWNWTLDIKDGPDINLPSIGTINAALQAAIGALPGQGPEARDIGWDAWMSIPFFRNLSESEFGDALYDKIVTFGNIVTAPIKWELGLLEPTIRIAGGIFGAVVSGFTIAAQIVAQIGEVTVDLIKWVLNLPTPEIPSITDAVNVLDWIEQKIDVLGDINFNLTSWNMKLPTPSFPDLSIDDVVGWITDAIVGLGEITVPMPDFKFGNPFGGKKMELGPGGDKAAELFGAGDSELTFTATFKGDFSGAQESYNSAQFLGDAWALATFTGTFDGDPGPAAIAYTDVSSWGAVWEDATFTSTFDIDNGPAAVAYTDAFGWGDTWASQVFTATFSIDTSGLQGALDEANRVAQAIRDIMPSSPAKKGPLSKPISFDYIADSLSSAMAQMAPLARNGMAGVAGYLHPGVGGFAGAGVGVSGGRSSANGGGLVINNYGTINVPEGYSDFRSAMSAWASGEAQA